MTTTPIFGLTGEHKIWNPNASPSLRSQYVGKQHYDISKKEGEDKAAVQKAWNIPHTTAGVKKSENSDKISKFGFNITKRKEQLKKQKKGGKSRKKRGGAPLEWPLPWHKGDEIQLTREDQTPLKGNFNRMSEDDDGIYLDKVFELKDDKWQRYNPPGPAVHELFHQIAHPFRKENIETIEIIGKPSGASRAAGGRKRKTRRKKKKRRKSRRKKKTKRGRKRRKRKTSRKKHR